MLSISAPSFAVATLVGMASGLHAATWGMYKDSPYEGFSARKYARSVLAGAGAAIAIQLWMNFPLNTPAGLLMLFGLAYVLERVLVEFHKSFIRVEDQSKYFIPMAFAVGGRVVFNQWLRRAAGILYATLICLVVAGVGQIGRHGPVLHPLATLLVVGSIGGWLSAFGGAWKDAPKEGFQILKFFRSPLISLSYAFVLSTLTTNWLAIAFGALGFTIATIETRKTFASKDAPGKFSGKPVRHPETLRLRRRFVPVFATIWILVLTSFAATLATPHAGLLASIQLADPR